MARPKLDFETLPLLAKSLPKGHPTADPPPRSCTLLGHLEDVMAAARAVVELAGPPALRNAGLEVEVWLPRLERALVRAAAVHDLGKANTRFQAMVRRDASAGLDRQPVRHEAISTWLLLQEDQLRPHFFPDGIEGSLEDFCALLAVIGHHVKFWDRPGGGGPGTSDPLAVGTIRLLLGHSDFTRCLALLDVRAPLKSIEINADQLLQGAGGGVGVEEALNELWEEHSEALGYQRFDPWAALESPWGRFLALVRALLVGCDVVGSATPRSGLSPEGWARQCLSSVLKAQELEDIVRKRLGNPADLEAALLPFQREVAASGARITVAEAGCGSGKTLAAYAWGAHRAVGRKLFMSYPTTGTASEGFADYLLASGVPADLVHGRASVDLEALHRNGACDEVEQRKDALLNEDSEEEETLARLKGLELWTTKVCACTVDTVLGVMQHHRRGLSGSPPMAGAAFVFDEVHAYDEELWGALEAFLRWLPEAPVLLMTATLPRVRQERLRELFGEEVAFIQGPAELEELKRYTITPGYDDGAALEDAVRAVEQGQRVLWVCNTVNRALEFGRELEKRLGAAEERVVVYHSRFRYEDRVNRHRALVRRFAAEPGGCGIVAVTTQVAEMSLDLDADLLITELAPAPALIQRMGRLNRKAKPGSCAPRRCLVLEFGEDGVTLPYKPQEIELARQWMERLPEGALSQRELAAAFVEVQSDGAAVVREPAPPNLIGQPVNASPGSLREAGVTGSFILERDQAAARKDPEAAIRATLPMVLPKREHNYREWERVGMAYVIPKGCVNYDKRLGASWTTR